MTKIPYSCEYMKLCVDVHYGILFSSDVSFHSSVLIFRYLQSETYGIYMRISLFGLFRSTYYVSCYRFLSINTIRYGKNDVGRLCLIDRASTTSRSPSPGGGWR